MERRDHGKYTLTNAFEPLVREMVDNLMSQDSEICQCEKCYLDVCALVLNNKLYNYTCFVTTHAGALLARVPEASYYNKTDMTVVVLDAIRMVKERPKHNA